MSISIADSGASTTYIHPAEEQGQESECGRYKWDPLFVSTGEEIDRMIQMACGNTAPGEDIVHIPGLSLRTEADTSHTVKGVMNNLGSMSTMTRNGYIPIFDTKKIVYTTRGT